MVRSVHRFILLLATLSLLIASIIAGTSPASAQEETQQEIVVQIPIPGMTFDCKVSGHEGRQCVSSLGDYVSKVYQFFGGAVGVIAAVMVLWGGIKWITASGNTSRVQDAKQTIYSAVIAILIVFGSYILLFTINPELVKLQLPDIKIIGTIEQLSERCSDNPYELIDFENSSCDPTKGECCGKEMKLKLQGGQTEANECFWDVCSKMDELCVTLDDTERFSRFAKYECMTAYQYCFLETERDTREWCPKVDTEMRQAKTPSFGDKFVYTGCGFDNVRGGMFGPDQCRWSVTLDKYFDLYREPDGYQPQFIDCYTEGAKGVCWELDDGKKVPKNCAGDASRQPCANVTDVPRPVAGASGGCLVKIGQTGSTNPDDYKCYAVPTAYPQQDGPYGSPPSF